MEERRNEEERTEQREIGKRLNIGENSFAFNEKPCGCIACACINTSQVYSSGTSDENSARSRF